MSLPSFILEWPVTRHQSQPALPRGGRAVHQVDQTGKCRRCTLQTSQHSNASTRCHKAFIGDLATCAVHSVQKFVMGTEDGLLGPSWQHRMCENSNEAERLFVHVGTLVRYLCFQFLLRHCRGWRAPRVIPSLERGAFIIGLEPIRSRCADRRVTSEDTQVCA